MSLDKYAISPGRVDSDPTEVTLWGDRLLFGAWHPEVGNELWVLDLQTRETLLLGDLQRGYAGPWGQYESILIGEAGGLAYFTLDYDRRRAIFDTGRELWVTDGTAENTSIHSNPAANLAKTLGLMDKKSRRTDVFSSRQYRWQTDKNIVAYGTESAHVGSTREPC